MAESPTLASYKGPQDAKVPFFLIYIYIYNVHLDAASILKAPPGMDAGIEFGTRLGKAGRGSLAQVVGVEGGLGFGV